MSCKYCNENERLQNSRNINMRIVKNVNDYIIDCSANGYDKCIFFEIPINYCPMCGRKL